MKIPFARFFEKRASARPRQNLEGGAALISGDDGWFRGFTNRIIEMFGGEFQKDIHFKTETVLAYWAVFRCILLKATDVAKCRIKLMQQGDDGMWSEVLGLHPWSVLEKPNRYQTRIKFIERWVISLESHGNTYVLKGKDQRGIVNALYILNPLTTDVLVAPDGSVFYRLRPNNMDGQIVPEDILPEEDRVVPATEIIHHVGAALFHPLIGVSPIFACGVAATQGLAIQKNSANFFTHGSMPGGIITVPGSITKEKADELKARWEANYGGKNVGRTAVLADKMEYKPVSITPTDSQLVEQLNMTATMVCATFGVPPYKAGVKDPPANANIGAMEQSYYGQCLQTIFENIELLLEEGLNLGNVAGKTYSVEFDLDALIRLDPMAQMEFVEKGVKASVFAPNEGRRRFNLPKVKGGDSPMIQQQNFSLEAIAKRDALDNPWFQDIQTRIPTPANDQNTKPATDAPADEAKDIAERLTEALALTSKSIAPLTLAYDDNEEAA